MFWKNSYDGEDKDLPWFIKVVIVLAVMCGMLVFAWKVNEWSTEKDMELQYPEQFVKLN